MASLLSDGGVPARIVTHLDEPADLGRDADWTAPADSAGDTDSADADGAAGSGTGPGDGVVRVTRAGTCLLYTSPSPRD